MKKSALHRYGFDPAVPIVAIEGYAAEGRSPSQSTISLAGQLALQGVQAITIRKETFLSTTGTIGQYGVVRGAYQHAITLNGDRPVLPHAWRVRAIHGKKDPSWMRPDAGYNSREFRAQILSRTSVAHLFLHTLGPQAPFTVIRPGMSPADFPAGEQLLVKPRHAQNLSQETLLLDRDTAARNLTLGLLKDSIVQAKISTAKPVHVAATAGAQLTPRQVERMQDGLHAIYIFDPLWRAASSLPPLAWMQWRAATPNDKGKLPSPEYIELKPEQLFCNFPLLNLQHQKLWQRMRERYGVGAAPVVSYIIDHEGRAVPNAIATRDKSERSTAMGSLEAHRLAQLAKEHFAKRN